MGKGNRSIGDYIKELVLNEIPLSGAQTIKWQFKTDYSHPESCAWEVTMELDGFSEEEIGGAFEFISKYGCDHNLILIGDHAGLEIKFTLSSKVISKLKSPISDFQLLSDIFIEIASDEVSLDCLPKTDFFKNEERLAPLFAGKDFNLF